MNKRLEDLEIGDEVVIDTGYNQLYLAKVVRFTKTRIIVKTPSGNENAYMKRTLKKVGESGSWRCPEIRKHWSYMNKDGKNGLLYDKDDYLAWIAEIKEQRERNKLMNKIQQVRRDNLRQMSTQQLQAVRELIFGKEDEEEKA